MLIYFQLKNHLETKIHIFLRMFLKLRKYDYDISSPLYMIASLHHSIHWYRRTLDIIITQPCPFLGRVLPRLRYPVYDSGYTTAYVRTYRAKVFSNRRPNINQGTRIKTRMIRGHAIEKTSEKRKEIGANNGKLDLLAQSILLMAPSSVDFTPRIYSMYLFLYG